MLLMKNKNIKFVKTKEEINLDEVIMNIEFREIIIIKFDRHMPYSTFDIGRTLVTLTSIERTSRNTQPLHLQSSFDFTQYFEQR